MKKMIMLGTFVLVYVNCCLSQFLTISVSDKVHFVVTDAHGRKTGYDTLTKTIVKDIPNSGYSREGVGYIGEEENIEPDNVYEFWLEDESNFGPFLINVYGIYGGKFNLRIDRGIQNRYVQDVDGYIIRGGLQEFTLGFNTTNQGHLTKKVDSNSLEEDLQAILAVGDIGDNHFGNDMVKEVNRFEEALKKPDTSNAVKILMRFQGLITKEHEKGIKQSPNRYVRPAAWKVLYDDAQSLIDVLASSDKQEKSKEKN